MRWPERRVRRRSIRWENKCINELEEVKSLLRETRLNTEENGGKAGKKVEKMMVRRVREVVGVVTIGVKFT